MGAYLTLIFVHFENVLLQFARVRCLIFAEIATKFLAVNLLMHSKTVFSSELLVALCAAVGVGSVTSRVPLKVVLSCKGARTFVAAETTFLLMTGRHVTCQRVLVDGGKFALTALVILRSFRWSNVSVDVLDMPCQVFLVGEPPCTFIAFELRLLEMRQRVSLQITGTVETFVALVAAEPCLCFVDQCCMPGQATLPREPLRAQIAAPSPDLVVNGLHVSVQVRCATAGMRTQATGELSRKLVNVSRMTQQITSLSKCFAAFGIFALERLLIRVVAHMTKQVGIVSARVAAAFNRTCEALFTVHCSLVIPACPERRALLPANVAAKGRPKSRNRYPNFGLSHFRPQLAAWLRFVQ